ncbi:type 4a pilus biogenesis protein PilO [Candidatus Peregrinibacteria bacterium]|jgi:Tfp pilus assembly protein PilO|nr:type 4a pilus biogenesis protein PilO [Candidatus Peregrinibacteria bacterium]MBT7736057.1 type 4a pilus biogenesis protein PilO [Candidatus Peregrinibacteria bacterium]
MLGDEKNNIEMGSKSKTGTIIGSFLVLISVVVLTFLARPVASEVSVLKANTDAQKATLETIKAQISELEQAEQDLGLTTEVKKSQAKGSIPANMDQDEVIRDVIEISEENDIQLKSIGFGKGSSDKEGLSTLSVNASFEGNYSDLISFLKGIEENQRLFRVNSISVQINKIEIIDISRATFSISMDAFYQSK